MTDKKISTGTNDRPRDATIAQTGEGLPDDSGRPVEVDEGQIERIKDKLVGDQRSKLKKEVKESIDAPQRGSA